VNCGLVNFATVVLAGVTTMEIKGLVTVRGADPVMPADVALIVTLPGATPVAKPPADTVAIGLLDECQFAVDVRSCVLPS